MNEPYLTRLTLQLLDGIERLPEAVRNRHLRYLQASQNPDGGFSGRQGGSDIYYTGFALRSLAVLQGLTPELATDASNYLRKRMTESASVIDLFSLLVSAALVQLGSGIDLLAETSVDWKSRVGETLEGFRMTDGGYAKTPDAKAGSTYHSFLVVLTLELLDLPIPRTEELIAFIRSRRREDGGYVEVAPMKRSGANPTAAAIGILQITDALDADARTAVIEFLRNLPSEFDGGYRANDRIPTADLLSTFTACWTLDQLGARDVIDVHAIQSFALALEAGSGGFRGGLWDEGIDVEYTFYGLGTLALFA